MKRVAIGLGLIAAFSVGLAAVLCALGMLLVRARGFVDRRSAVVVTLLGVEIALKGVLSAAG